MFYTIYKITNLINDKIYIGKHQTKNLDDGYMGSGKRLGHAKSKYGIDNFKKEILFIFETETEMNAKEKELVTDEFCLKEDTYNLCPGGHGGWGYANRTGLNNSTKDWNILSKKFSEIRKGIPRPYMSQKLRDSYKEGRRVPSGACSPQGVIEMHRRSLSPEANLKRSETMKTKTGNKNSQYGTMWITNGIESKKISREDSLPGGWTKGRIIKSK